MTLLVIFLGLLGLVLLISWGKFNPFLAFLLVSLGIGYFLGIPLDKLTGSLKKGIGEMLGELVVIIGLGAMLGKLVAESGAAQKISQTLMQSFGPGKLIWALMITAFIVGIPLFYNVGFVLLIPLVFSVVYQTKIPALQVGIPVLSALSVTHGFLPPHPSPTALVAQFHASLGMTLLYGITIAIPTILVAGYWFGKTLGKIPATPLQTFQPTLRREDQLPGSWNSFLSSLLPVILLVITTLLIYNKKEAGPSSLLSFLGDPLIVMLFSLLMATFSLGLREGRNLKQVMDWYTEAIKDVAPILLVVAGAGALKQVMVDSGVSKEIGNWMQGMHLNPLILGWLIASLIRVSVGSATVAGLTAAGIVAPLLVNSQVDPNLMVLSVGAGSLMFSHVNDSGFWMFKEYFNLSIKNTIRSWSLMETIVAVMGLLGVLILEQIIH